MPKPKERCSKPVLVQRQNLDPVVVIVLDDAAVLRDPNRKNHYSRNNYKKMRQMSEQARDKNA